ncbi:hypothetical protein INP57_27420 [Saccharopolyspora sp. HNM0986]|uniref:hypothetical protein n=1 Tax=Saccharopolyspora galaxeae TaxID=2781241 RepID=UPI00190A23EE|nr:hypothetical protein [Saccharopolyspora sp. HNM0986]MBK0870542.1 hypothetical protein [Saccharopolyspora sp. HNM0986]
MTTNLDHLSGTDRKAITNRADNEGREIAEVPVDLIRAGLRDPVHNVNTGFVNGTGIQSGRIDGGFRL